MLDNDEQSETWKEHTLYKLNNKANVEDMCRKNHIPIPSGKIPKHRLVKHIVENHGEETPSTTILYAGNLDKKYYSIVKVVCCSFESNTTLP